MLCCKVETELQGWVNRQTIKSVIKHIIYINLSTSILRTVAGIKIPTFTLFPAEVACAGCFPLLLASLCKYQRESEAGKNREVLERQPFPGSFYRWAKKLEWGTMKGLKRKMTTVKQSAPSLSWSEKVFSCSLSLTQEHRGGEGERNFTCESSNCIKSVAFIA